HDLDDLAGEGGPRKLRPLRHGVASRVVDVAADVHAVGGHRRVVVHSEFEQRGGGGFPVGEVDVLARGPVAVDTCNRRGLRGRGKRRPPAGEEDGCGGGAQSGSHAGQQTRHDVFQAKTAGGGEVAPGASSGLAGAGSERSKESLTSGAGPAGGPGETAEQSYASRNIPEAFADAALKSHPCVRPSVGSEGARRCAARTAGHEVLNDK